MSHVCVANILLATERPRDPHGCDERWKGCMPSHLANQFTGILTSFHFFSCLSRLVMSSSSPLMTSTVKFAMIRSYGLTTCAGDFPLFASVFHAYYHYRKTCQRSLLLASSFTLMTVGFVRITVDIRSLIVDQVFFPYLSYPSMAPMFMYVL